MVFISNLHFFQVPHIYYKQTNTNMNTLNYDLVELVIHFDDESTESMIVSLDSFAHEAVLEYARINQYKLDCLTPDEQTFVV